MRVFFGSLLTVTCISAVALAQTSSNSHQRAAGNVVKGSGCVEAGIEAGCIIVHDLKSQTNYNLFFKEKPPALDTAIEFDGVTSDNPNICMEGKPVNVTRYTTIRMHCPQTSPHQGAQALDGTKFKCDGWHAWFNSLPGAQKAIHVSGICTFPTSGYKPSLSARVPAGFNPKILILDLKIAPPTGKVSYIIRHVPVTFAKNADTPYDSVTIEPDHVSFPVEIIH